MAKNNLSKLNFKNLFKSKKKDESRKRTIKTWSILGGVGVAVAIGIGVPVGIVNNTVTQIPALNGTNPGITINLPGDNKKVVNIDELINRSLTSTTVNQQTYTKYNQALAEVAYQEEYVMSLTFSKALAASSLASTAAPTGFTELNSLETIKTNQRKVINEQKANTQQQFGFNNWLTQWNNLLATDEKYGKTGSEEGAFNYLVLKAIEADANRRFNAQVLNVFSETFLNATVTSDVTYEGDIPSLGIKKGDVYLASGSKIFQNYYATTTGDKLQNYIVNPNGTQGARTTRIFSTNSFLNFLPESVVTANNVPTAATLVDRYLQKYSELYTVSSFNIDIKAPDTLTGNWTVSKETFKKLINYAIRNSNPVTFLSNDGVLKYGGAGVFANPTITEAEKTQVATDNFWFNTRSSNTSKTNHGFLSFGTIADLYNAVNPAPAASTNPATPAPAATTDAILLLALLRINASTAQAPANNLINTNVTVSATDNSAWNPITKLFTAIKDHSTFTSLFSSETVTADNAVQLNQEMNDKIDNIPTNDFQNAINAVMNQAFSVSERYNETLTNDADQKATQNARKIQYYDATNNLYIVLDSAGLRVVKSNSVKTKSEFNNYLINDLYANLLSNESQRFSFGAITKLQTLNNEYTNNNYYVGLLEPQVNANDGQLLSALRTQLGTTDGSSIVNDYAKYQQFVRVNAVSNQITSSRTVIDAATNALNEAISKGTYVDFLYNSSFPSVVEITRNWNTQIFRQLSSQLGVRPVQEGTN
ncbi:HinT-interacting membrane complex protein P80 [Mycoplasmopsis agassizii]|uniref:HinT-interacting membrane complex protein P80 n=1 Tax=Mycoplasmopsis agassizii TaxID=33922 RepID=UPI003528FEE6